MEHFWICSILNEKRFSNKFCLVSALCTAKSDPPPPGLFMYPYSEGPACQQPFCPPGFLLLPLPLFPIGDSYFLSTCMNGGGLRGCLFWSVQNGRDLGINGATVASQPTSRSCKATTWTLKGWRESNKPQLFGAVSPPFPCLVIWALHSPFQTLTSPHQIQGVLHERKHGIIGW